MDSNKLYTIVMLSWGSLKYIFEVLPLQTSHIGTCPCKLSCNIPVRDTFVVQKSHLVVGAKGGIVKTVHS